MTAKTLPAGALVYSYTRFSAMKQAEGHSVERQADYAATWAAKHGLSLDTALTMKDEGLSAYHQRHVKQGALGLFLRAVQEGRVPTGSVLIVESLDRLSRATPLEAQAQLALIVNAGITVVTAKDEREYSIESLRREPMQLIMSVIIMIRAHEESDQKSDRVTKAFRQQLEGWLTGTYKGRIRTGKDPLWVKWDKGTQKWNLVPERVAYVRRIIDLYRTGIGVNRIAKQLTAEGHTVVSGYLFRVVKNRSLLGEMEMTLGGTTYTLPNYYPAIVTQEEWNEMQSLAAARAVSKTRERSDVPSILSGIGVLKCAYCGLSLNVFNMLTKPLQADGRMRESSRRLRCLGRQGSHSYPNTCQPEGKGGGSVAPFERAIMNYCSDMLNLKSLYTGDRTAGPKAQLAAARAAITEIDSQLDKLLSAIMSMDKPPAAFAAKAQSLEADKEKHVAAIEQAERELAAAARINIVGLDEQWRALADGVEAQDYDACMKARKLVADTFERISVRWLRNAEGRHLMILRAKGGAVRHLEIDAEGKWVEAEEFGALPELKAA